MAATLILIEGRSGTGKSTSWENIPAEESFLLTPNTKPLPFKGSNKKYVEGKNKIITDKIINLQGILKKVSDDYPKVKYILLDDLNHYFNTRMMEKSFIAKKSGGEAFSKWNEFGSDVFSAICGIADQMRSDIFLVINAHTTEHNDGTIGLLTPGKLLEQTINLPSYFTYIFHTEVTIKDGKTNYEFMTNSDGVKEAKTPKGCFNQSRIPNDMFTIIKTIKQYQENE
jgi:hypothetical protein